MVYYNTTPHAAWIVSPGNPPPPTCQPHVMLKQLVGALRGQVVQGVQAANDARRPRRHIAAVLLHVPARSGAVSAVWFVMKTEGGVVCGSV